MFSIVRLNARTWRTPCARDLKVTDATTSTEISEKRPNTALSLDVEAYRHLVAGDGTSREEEARLIEAVWAVVVSFVDLAFGLHPVQQAMDVDKARFPLGGKYIAAPSCRNAFNKKSNTKAARHQPARKES